MSFIALALRSARSEVYSVSIFLAEALIVDGQNHHTPSLSLNAYESRVFLAGGTGRNSTSSNQNGVGDHIQSDKDITSIKGGHRPNPQVIRPILKETFDRIDTLIALDETLGPNDPTTELAAKTVKESLEAWRNEMDLEECFQATMKPMPKPAAKPSAEHLTWLKNVHNLACQEIKQPGPPGELLAKVESLLTIALITEGSTGYPYR
ncbi:hypothetical protein HYE68_006322 [Fusarium pseudograminearum]|nr:hypothetical protein HYE68_006322 [Fusarium pseudograminearum]